MHLLSPDVPSEQGLTDRRAFVLVFAGTWRTQPSGISLHPQTGLSKGSGCTRHEANRACGDDGGECHMRGWLGRTLSFGKEPNLCEDHKVTHALRPVQGQKCRDRLAKLE